jgi:hypothetical protein
MQNSLYISPRSPCIEEFMDYFGLGYQPFLSAFALLSAKPPANPL